MTVNSAVILMCQSCYAGGYLFIYYYYFITFFALILDL